MSSNLVDRGIIVFSFCRPSLGPTSTIRTSSARLPGVVEKAREETRGLHWQRKRHLESDMMRLYREEGANSEEQVRTVQNASMDDETMIDKV